MLEQGPLRLSRHNCPASRSKMREYVEEGLLPKEGDGPCARPRPAAARQLGAERPVRKFGRKFPGYARQ